MEFKIGHKYQINSKTNINNPPDQENNADKDGIITYLQTYLKIHGLWKNKINYLNYINKLVTNGKIYQNNLPEGIYY